MEPKIISYLSHYNGPPKGWIAYPTKEAADEHQAKLGERAGGIKPSEHVVPGTSWQDVAGYFDSDGKPLAEWPAYPAEQ